uniref:Uncharacterized protein n=1 Tax=Meloidogyne enterolobii TaxID=390850 RepID=A0A6V7UDZ3_MELEN|nr:unnamed protein product [Meloidogyne enterolobii]
MEYNLFKLNIGNFIILLPRSHGIRNIKTPLKLNLSFNIFWIYSLQKNVVKNI